MTAAHADPLSAPVLVTRWGDLGYVKPPPVGEFAVIHCAASEKRFYTSPLTADPLQLHAAIEQHFGTVAERIAEALWVV